MHAMKVNVPRPESIAVPGTVQERRTDGRRQWPASNARVTSSSACAASAAARSFFARLFETFARDGAHIAGRLLPVAVVVALLQNAAAYAAQPAVTSAGTLVEFAAEASRKAPNDHAQASAYVEATDSNPAELARKVNAALASALQTAKAVPSVKTRSGAVHTFPTYGKSGRIEGWRMRSELLMETGDIAPLSELLGRLQAAGLAVGQIALAPSPETRRKAEDEITLEAIAAFEARARLIAKAAGKPYRTRQMSIQSGRPPVMPVPRAAMMAADAAAPIEAGESQVTVTVSGQIELLGE
jgi:predicted secreted protein